MWTSLKENFHHESLNWPIPNLARNHPIRSQKGIPKNITGKYGSVSQILLSQNQNFRIIKTRSQITDFVEIGKNNFSCSKVSRTVKDNEGNSC